MKGRLKHRRDLWAPWFAWYPVKVFCGDGRHMRWVWREVVYRKDLFNLTHGQWWKYNENSP